MTTQRAVSFSTRVPPDKWFDAIERVADGAIMIQRTTPPKPPKATKKITSHKVAGKRKGVVYNGERVDVDRSLRSLGLTQGQLMRRHVKRGSPEDAIKMAIVAKRRPAKPNGVDRHE